MFSYFLKSELNLIKCFYKNKTFLNSSAQGSSLCQHPKKPHTSLIVNQYPQPFKFKLNTNLFNAAKWSSAPRATVVNTLLICHKFTPGTQIGAGREVENQELGPIGK